MRLVQDVCRLCDLMPALAATTPRTRSRGLLDSADMGDLGLGWMACLPLAEQTSRTEERRMVSLGLDIEVPSRGDRSKVGSGMSLRVLGSLRVTGLADVRTVSPLDPQTCLLSDWR